MWTLVTALNILGMGEGAETLLVKNCIRLKSTWQLVNKANFALAASNTT